MTFVVLITAPIIANVIQNYNFTNTDRSIHFPAGYIRYNCVNLWLMEQHWAQALDTKPDGICASTDCTFLSLYKCNNLISHTNPTMLSVRYKSIFTCTNLFETIIAPYLTSIFIFLKSKGKANGTWKVGETCSASERQRRNEETEYAEKNKSMSSTNKSH